MFLSKESADGSGGMVLAGGDRDLVIKCHTLKPLHYAIPLHYTVPVNFMKGRQLQMRKEIGLIVGR